MPNTCPNAAPTPSLDEAILALRSRRETGDLRSEAEVSGLSVLHLARRAQALGRLGPCEVDSLVQGVVRLVDALPGTRGDRP